MIQIYVCIGLHCITSYYRLVHDKGCHCTLIVVSTNSLSSGHLA